MERRDQQSDSRRLVYAVAPARVGSARICTRLAAARVFACAFASMLADGTPVRANDRSQSEVDGPRMLPSMKARPGQREQFETWEQEVQVDRSFTRIARTSFISSEFCQMSMKRRVRTFPVGSGNCTQGKTSP